MMAFDELLPSVCDATRKCVERKYHNHIFPFLSDVAMQTARAAFDSVFLRSDITSPRIGSLTQLECWQSFWSNILPSSPFLYFVKLKLVFLPVFFFPGKNGYQNISYPHCFASMLVQPERHKSTTVSGGPQLIKRPKFGLQQTLGRQQQPHCSHHYEESLQLYRYLPSHTTTARNEHSKKFSKSQRRPPLC